MKKGVLNLHTKISQSLAKSLRGGQINEDDTLAYMIFFDSLGEDEEIIKNSVLKIGKADNIFKDLIIEITGEENKKKDLEKADNFKKKIINNNI